MRFIWIINIALITSCSYALAQDELPSKENVQLACRLKPVDDIGSAKMETHTGKTLIGTSLFTECQKMVAASWEDISHMAKSSPGSLPQKFQGPDGNFYAFKNLMPQLLRDYNRKIDQVNNRGTVQTTSAAVCNERKMPSKELIREAAQLISAARTNLLNCIALATMSTEIDFGDSDHTQKGETASADGKLKCTTEGAETQDFPACKHFSYLYTGFVVGQKGVETIQTVGYESKSLERQEDLAKSASGTIKKSLEAQRDSIDDQKKMADQNAAFHGAKGAALLAAYRRIPDPAEFSSRCQNLMKKNILQVVNAQAKKSLSDFIGKMQTEQGSDIAQLDLNRVAEEYVFDDTQSSPCDDVINNAAVFMNQKAKQAMLEMMMQAGVDMLANAGKSVLLDKQASLMDKAIRDLDAFTSSLTIPTFATASLSADYCSVNPADPACLGVDSRRTYDLGSNSITVGGGTLQGTNDSSSALPDASTPSSSVTSSRKDVPGVTGGVVGDVSKGGGLESTVPVASLKDGGLGGGGGGGGGGPGSVSAPSSGGGGSGDGSGGGQNAIGSKTAGYFGGGNHSYSGGLGSGKKKGPEANPLDGLFNKQAAKPSNDVLDFRGVASINDKDKDIFKVISNRYENVSKSKRLMEYESVPK